MLHLRDARYWPSIPATRCPVLISLAPMRVPTRFVLVFSYGSSTVVSYSFEVQHGSPEQVGRSNAFVLHSGTARTDTLRIAFDFA
eukprot:2867045-Rhodomonas_salina.9